MLGFPEPGRIYEKTGTKRLVTAISTLKGRVWWRRPEGGKERETTVKAWRRWADGAWCVPRVDELWIEREPVDDPSDRYCDDTWYRGGGRPSCARKPRIRVVLMGPGPVRIDAVERCEAHADEGEAYLLNGAPGWASPARKA